MKSRLFNKKTKQKIKLKEFLLVLGLFFLITPLTGLAQGNGNYSSNNIFSKVSNKEPVRSDPFIKDFKIISQTNGSIKAQYKLINPQDSYMGGLYQEIMLLRESVPQRELSFEKYLKTLPKSDKKLLFQQVNL
ncbi:MAG: hypothetical protein GWP10_11375 [Nitrospiraceae bacterium]|nr:hypothetical protein [Nitrospiraceae bacterium]